MTHLSDYSYIDRGLQTVCLLAFCVYRLTVQRQWSMFSMSQLKKRELRSIVGLLLLSSLLLLFAYDIITTKVKYEEGFEYSEKYGKIMTKSKKNYTDSNLDLIQKTDLVWNLACTFKSSALFLLLAMFHHTVKASGLNFMSSREFTMSRIYAVISVAAYPALQFIFYSDPLLSTIVPQFVYSFECFMIVLLTQTANYRFRKLSLSMPTNSSVGARIKSFINLNNMLSVSSFMDGFGLSIINMDIIVTSWRNVLHNKFATDFLTKIFNMGYSGTFLVMIFVLLPTETGFASRSTRGSSVVSSKTMTNPVRKSSITKKYSVTAQKKYRVVPLQGEVAAIDVEAQTPQPTK